MNQSKNSSHRPGVMHLLERLSIRNLALLLFVFCLLLYLLGPQVMPAYKEVFVSFSISLFASLIKPRRKTLGFSPRDRRRVPFKVAWAAG
jgi:hypothetical protein